MWQAWINVVAGVWAIISGLTAGLSTSTNFLITGLVIAVFGFWRPRHKWQGLVSGVLGVWLVVSTFIPELWVQPNMFIVGIAVVILAAWRIADTHPRQHTTSQTAH